MINIAHRGNISGPSHLENHPEHLLNAISKGYDVELDLWVVSDELWLGHDGPCYKITESFLLEIGYAAWIHCKNIEALDFLVSTFPQLNFFWHQSDDYTITSQGYIWAYPGKSVTVNTVIVDLLSERGDVSLAYGICSDTFI